MKMMLKHRVQIIPLQLQNIKTSYYLKIICTSTRNQKQKLEVEARKEELDNKHGLMSYIPK